MHFIFDHHSTRQVHLHFSFQFLQTTIPDTEGQTMTAMGSIKVAEAIKMAKDEVFKKKTKIDLS